MKKDIDTLIAEERTEIISKYDKVSECIEIYCTHSSGQSELEEWLVLKFKIILKEWKPTNARCLHCVN